MAKIAPSDRQSLLDIAARQIRPATELSDEEIEAAPFGGIGYMGIEVDFMVR